MIIDNPEVMREIIRDVKPYCMHQGAEELYASRSAELDACARRYGEYIDGVWDEEYVKR